MKETKPKITLDLIEYKPLQGQSYPVYVVNDAHRPPYTQGYIHCTGCGKGHQYRWDANIDRWVMFKCPNCDTISAWFEEYDDEEWL